MFNVLRYITEASETEPQFTFSFAPSIAGRRNGLKLMVQKQIRLIDGAISQNSTVHFHHLHPHYTLPGPSIVELDFHLHIKSVRRRFRSLLNESSLRGHLQVQ